MGITQLHCRPSLLDFSIDSNQARMQGVRGGAEHPPPNKKQNKTNKQTNKKQSGKNREKIRKKSRTLTKITTMLFTNGSKVRSFRGSNPLTPNFVEVHTSPKNHPVYARTSDSFRRIKLSLNMLSVSSDTFKGVQLTL